MLYQPAPFLRRLAARLLDLLFSLALTFLFAIPVGLLFLATRPLLGEQASIGATVAVSYFLAYVGLEVFLLVRREGQSLGKGLLSLRVVQTNDRWPAPLRVGQAVVRMLLIFLPFVFASLAGSAPDNAGLNAAAGVGAATLALSAVLAALPGRRRALHDLVGATRVATATKRPINWARDMSMMAPGKIDMTKRV